MSDLIKTRKGIFIPDITVEMFRNTSLEAVEELLVSGEMQDIILPSAESERKKGKWRRRLVDCGFNADWHCSECGWKTSLEEHGYNYCPNCGSYNGGEHE